MSLLRRIGDVVKSFPCALFLVWWKHGLCHCARGLCEYVLSGCCSARLIKLNRVLGSIF